MQIRGVRLISAFAAAVIAPACILTAWYLYDQFVRFEADSPYIWIRTQTFSLYCLALTSLHVVVLGIPGYFVLRWRDALHWRSILVCGFVLGAVPGAVMTWPLQYAGTQSYSVVNGVILIADGLPTFAGWMHFLSGIVFLGLCGLSGATMFWFVERPRHKVP